MTFEQCFQNLDIHPTLGSREYVFVKHANRTDSYRIFARYSSVSNGQSFRKDYEDLLGINLTNGREWQWHHVVEKTYLQQLFLPADFRKLIQKSNSHSAHSPGNRAYRLQLTACTWRKSCVRSAEPKNGIGGAGAFAFLNNHEISIC